VCVLDHMGCGLFYAGGGAPGQRGGTRPNEPRIGGGRKKGTQAAWDLREFKVLGGGHKELFVGAEKKKNG